MLRTILEADEIDTRKISETETEVVMLTSGIQPNTAKLKAKVFKLLGVPFKIYDVDQVEEVQKGIITKRYKITGRIQHTPGKGMRKMLEERELAGKLPLDIQRRLRRLRR